MGEKIHELIIQVKQSLNLEEKEYEQTIRDIQNKIDDKNL